MIAIVDNNLKKYISYRLIKRDYIYSKVASKRQWDTFRCNNIYI